MQTATQTPKATVAEMLAARLGPNLVQQAKDIFRMKHCETAETAVFYARQEFIQYKGKKIKANATQFAEWAEVNGFTVAIVS